VFELAAIKGNLELVTCLADYGVNIKDSAALYWASNGGHLDIVKFLIEHGDSINKKFVVGRTALHQASTYGYYEIISYLLDHGAWAKIQDDDGKTPLDKAKEWRDFHTDKDSIASVEILEAKKR
jgi:ankyrin repeat protein